MNYTDDQLKQLLAKLSGDAEGVPFGGRLESEYLHLCSLVEAGLTEKEWEDYAHALFNIAHPHDDCGSFEGIARAFLSATWQQRTRALAELKGVTI